MRSPWAAPSNGSQAGLMNSKRPRMERLKMGQEPKKAVEIARLRAWLECIERTTDEEIAVRFRTSSYKTEEQMAGKSVVYTMLSVPRNMARRALAGDPYILDKKQKRR